MDDFNLIVTVDISNGAVHKVRHTQRGGGGGGGGLSQRDDAYIKCIISMG